jgi:predicted Zn-dependent protease
VHEPYYNQIIYWQPFTCGLKRLLVPLLASLLLLAGCATNPVTGKKELMLIPESMELEMGRENYKPARQMQGGDYVADPAVTAYVNEVGQRLAAVSDRKLPYEFVVLNNSGINAWAMPGGKLAINRGMLMKMDSESELAAVLGHEIVHAAAKHGAKQMQQALMLQGAVLAANIAIASQTDNENVQILGTIGTQVAATLLSSKFSRDDERQSDHYGMTYMSRAGYDPYGAVRMQELLLKESQGKDSNLFFQLLSTHPPSQERIDANRAFAATLPAGKTGRGEYKRRLSSLFRAAPAYAAYDEGLKALKENDFNRARTLADKAIRIEPREAQFHLLKGSVLEKSYQGKQALAEYRQAAQLNPGYFEPHLKLGLLYDAMGNRYYAKQALENSINLLKTAPALHRLGKYALAEGNQNLARQYLREAASSNSPDGKTAYAELLRFDLPANAGRYLSVDSKLDGSGQLQFVIRNKTPFPVSDVMIEAWDNSGSKRLNLGGVIQGNSQSVFNVGVQATQEQINNTRVRVVSARLSQ